MFLNLNITAAVAQLLTPGYRQCLTNRNGVSLKETVSKACADCNSGSFRSEANWSRGTDPATPQRCTGARHCDERIDFVFSNRFAVNLIWFVSAYRV